MPSNWVKGNKKREKAWKKANDIWNKMSSEEKSGKEKYAYIMGIAQRIANEQIEWSFGKIKFLIEKLL